MKKLFLVLIFFSMFSAFAKPAELIEKYDEVRDCTVIECSFFNNDTFYNIKDSISGERANIRFYIVDGRLGFSVAYQFSEWAFVQSVVFFGNGKRIKINVEETNHKVGSGFVREFLFAELSKEDAETLRDILADENANISFLGKKRSLEKIKIKKDVRAASLMVIEKFLEN